MSLIMNCEAWLRLPLSWTHSVSSLNGKLENNTAVEQTKHPELSQKLLHLLLGQSSLLGVLPFVLAASAPLLMRGFVGRIELLNQSTGRSLLGAMFLFPCDLEWR